MDGDDSIIWISLSSRERSYRLSQVPAECRECGFVFYHSYRMHTPNSPFGYSFRHDSSTLLEKGWGSR